MSGQDSLELRLERIKRLDNAESYFLQRLYKWPLSIQDYVEHRVDAHVHIHCGETRWCGVYRSRVDGHVCGEKVGDDVEFPVLVDVCDSGESFRPVDSIVRLQSLNRCDMCAVDSLEEGFLPSFEAVWRVFDRKLRAALLDSAIKLGEAENEIVEGRPQIIGDVASEDRDSIRDGRGVAIHPDPRPALVRIACIYRAFRIRLEPNGLGLSVLGIAGKSFQLREMLFGPLHPEISFQQVGHETGDL